MTNNDYKDFDLFGGFGVKIYSNIATHNTICDIWSASTKHPDVRYSMNKDRDNGDFTWGMFSTEEENTIQWLLLNASRCQWFFTAMEIVNLINTYRNDKKGRKNNE